MRTLLLFLRNSFHVFFGVGSCCRFDPCCSLYAREATEEHGFFRGSWYAIIRISRCHHWGGFGFDPVPSRKSVVRSH